MENSFIYKTERPWPNPRLHTAAIVGHTTPTSTKLWFRVGRPGKYVLLLYPETVDRANRIFDRFKDVPYSLAGLPAGVMRCDVVVKNWDSDATVVVDLPNRQIPALSPATTYRYALWGNDNGIERILLGQDRVHSFRTLDAADDVFSFAFFTCHMPYKKSLFRGSTKVHNIEMWDYLAAALRRHAADELQFIIGGGDQVYVDGVDSLDIWKYLNSVMGKERGKLLPTVTDMVTWYRDIYRGYWGFKRVGEVFSSYPTYMIWDDHELGDGWGSYYFPGKKRKDELPDILPGLKEKRLTKIDGHELLRRMGQAAKQAYQEYVHSHNPNPVPGEYDYFFNKGSTAFYVLDGRGHRDINRDAFKILGEPQVKRFRAWLAALDPATTKFLFVVSAVPMVHLHTVLANSDAKALVKELGLADDLRDSWEHEMHQAERRAILEALFQVADKGIRVSILSGDVHTAAVFRLRDKTSTIYQLTSSAITYNVPRPLGWLLGAGVPDEGKTQEGYRFERLALYTDSNFSLIKVDPAAGRAVFQLYGEQSVAPPDVITDIELNELPVTHSIAKIMLDF